MGGGIEKLLACPLCKSSVVMESLKVVCQNKACGLEFPIRNGIPVMLIEEAKKPSKVQ